MNIIITYFISTAGRCQYTQFLKFTEVNLLSCLICLSGKMANQRYDWSDRLSIKLFANGQLNQVFCLMQRFIIDSYSVLVPQGDYIEKTVDGF